MSNLFSFLPFLNRVRVYFIAPFFAFLSITIAYSGQTKTCYGQKLKKELFYSSAKLTSITNIVHKNFKKDTIFVFGQRSMQAVDLKGKKMEYNVNFEWPTGILRPDLAFIRKDKYMIVSRGPVSKLGVMNCKGEVKWIFNPGPDIVTNTMCFGDLNKDNSIEFYVATDEGIFQLDNEGKTIWKKGQGSNDVKVFEFGKESFIASARIGGSIDFYDFNGDLKRTVKTSTELYEIEPVEWLGVTCILTYNGSYIFILDQNGRIIFSQDLGENIYMLRGISVCLKGPKNPYLAILAKYSSASGKSMFCVITPEKNVFYKELINVSQGLSVIDNDIAGDESILVGDGIGNVFEYAVRP